MNTVNYNDKIYKEFELPKEGKFFTPSIQGLFWNDDDALTIVSGQLNCIFPDNNTGNNRVYTSSGYYKHCALLNDEVIDPIRHPTVEDVKRGCFVEVIKTNELVRKGFIFFANLIQSSMIETPYIVICNNYTVPLNWLKFLCYADEFNMKNTNKPLFFTIDDIKKYGIKDGDQIELYSENELFAFSNIKKKSTGEVKYCDTTIESKNYLGSNELCKLGKTYTFSNFSPDRMYIQTHEITNLIPVWCVKRIIKKTIVNVPKYLTMAELHKLRLRGGDTIELFSVEELFKLNKFYINNNKYFYGSMDEFLRSDEIKFLGKTWKLNNFWALDCRNYIIVDGFSNIIPVWCIKNIHKNEN